MTLVIGIGSKARHGKDTAGEAIVDHYARKREMFYKHGQVNSRLVTAKIYKWADALYTEVNDFLSKPTGQNWAQGGNNTQFFLYNGTDIVSIPSWVKPEPNAEKTKQAPLGKHPKLLQWWGTEYRRSQDAQYWVKKLIAQIVSENPDVALITDTRFKNEVAAVKALGGYTLNISRKNADGTTFVDPSRPADHISETELDDWNWDLKIVNSYGHAALVGELAITYVEYLRALERK